MDMEQLRKKEMAYKKAITWFKENMLNLSRLRISARIAMTDYAIERAIKAYRERAKEMPNERRHCLREALRLRSMLRTGCQFRYHLEGTGRCYPLIPFVTPNSDLAYTSHNAR